MPGRNFWNKHSKFQSKSVNLQEGMPKNKRMSKNIKNYNKFIKIYIYQIWHAMFRGQNQDSCDCGPKRGLGQPV